MLSAQGIGAKDYMHSRDVLLLLVTTDVMKLSKSIIYLFFIIVLCQAMKKQIGSNSISKLDVL